MRVDSIIAWSTILERFSHDVPKYIKIFPYPLLPVLFDCILPASDTSGISLVPTYVCCRMRGNSRCVSDAYTFLVIAAWLWSSFAPALAGFALASRILGPSWLVVPISL